jgi:DNA-directed RNA polymerase specialized sigma24 family protein
VEFEEYLSTHGARLERLAVVLCADHHLAQDVLQDALIRAYNRWDNIGGLEHPQAYVRTIVFNELMSWRRKWGARRGQVGGGTRLSCRRRGRLS